MKKCLNTSAVKFGFMLICLLTFTQNLQAQTNLLDELEKEAPLSKEYTVATFKGTRLINGHSVEILKKKHLDYVISHRFGAIDFSNPLYDFIGMDAANTRMAFEYGLLSIGL